MESHVALSIGFSTIPQMRVVGFKPGISLKCEVQALFQIPICMTPILPVFSSKPRRYGLALPLPSRPYRLGPLIRHGAVDDSFIPVFLASLNSLVWRMPRLDMYPLTLARLLDLALRRACATWPPLISGTVSLRLNPWSGHYVFGFLPNFLTDRSLQKDEFEIYLSGIETCIDRIDW
jgi:hypothetical protein